MIGGRLSGTRPLACAYFSSMPRRAPVVGLHAVLLDEDEETVAGPEIRGLPHGGGEHEAALGAEARRTMASRFSLAQTATAYIGLYRELLNGTSR